MSWQLSFLFVPLGCWLLAWFVLVRRLDAGLRTKIWWMAALLLCWCKFQGFLLIGGNAFCPDLPEALIWIWDWAYSGAMFLLGLSCLCLPRFRAKIWLLPALAWGTSAWGLWNGIKVPEVHEVELEFASLPEELDGYRIVQLTDLHCSSAARRWRTQAIVDLANAQRPDLICLTGDYVDGYVEDRAEFLEPIGGLRARDGVYACTGNHEYYFRRKEWQNEFYAHLENIRFLANECAFPRPGLAVAGVPDIVGGAIDGWPNPQKALAAATNGEFRILLQHRPGTYGTKRGETPVDLQLSGHTHGGIAPVMRSLVARFNDSFVRGVYRTGGTTLYVSTGCGQWAGFPLRFFTPSEVAVIRLKKAR